MEYVAASAHPTRCLVLMLDMLCNTRYWHSVWCYWPTRGTDVVCMGLPGRDQLHSQTGVLSLDPEPGILSEQST
eukprot:2147213-Rhodomonas_salina.2